MRLIFIRHAEPDYDNNTLTKRGFEEAEILSHRISKWENIDRFYTSPLARAQLTAKPSLEKLGRTAEVLPWMREFSYGIADPTTGKWRVPWDFMPQFWTEQPQFFDKDDFWKHPVLQTNKEYEKAVMNLRKGLDDLLAEYGYHRHGAFYQTDEDKVRDDDDRTVVIFGHLGANSEALGYLLAISPVVLQQSIYQAPTSVSILNAEKRQPGIAMFRAQAIGDVSHLLAEGEAISDHGSFAKVFQQ